MQIVINIPEDSYKATCNGCMLPPDVNNVVQGIKNGTPLPEGHGDLTDKDILAKRMIEYGWHHPDSTVREFIEDDLPTIIEADKAESDGKEWK